MGNNFLKIEEKHKDLIEIAIKYMSSINDNEHNIMHVMDVVNYTKELINLINGNIDKEVCIIAAYWHDVGRIKLDIGHEKLSAEMLKENMKKLNYELDFIDKCYSTIEKHKWNMTPTTKEGLIVKDADKLSFLGKGRWKECLRDNQKLDSIIELLPILRNEILYFEESRKIYDRDIINLVKMLYSKILDTNLDTND